MKFMKRRSIMMKFFNPLFETIFFIKLLINPRLDLIKIFMRIK